LAREVAEKAYIKLFSSNPTTQQGKDAKEEAIKKHEATVAAYNAKKMAEGIKNSDKAAADAVSGEGDALPKSEPSAAEKALADTEAKAAVPK
jgi:hypothetical protein